MELNRLLKRTQRNDQQIHEKYSTLLTTRKIKIKTTLSYHCTSRNMTIIKTLRRMSPGKGEKKEPLCTISGNAN